MRRLAGAMAGLILALSPLSASACTKPANAAALATDAGAAMNQVRSQRGRAKLDRDARLDQAAQAHACWMSRTGKFSHTGQNGSQPHERIAAAGYAARLSSENIAWGQQSGRDVVASWMDSQGHRENILRRNIDDYGVGVALIDGRPVWVMVYTRP